MGSYVIKRLLKFIPTLILITLLGFWLSNSAPIDAAENIALREDEGNTPPTAQQKNALLKEYRHKYGLDLPLFYISVRANYECDTLERIPNRAEREALQKLNEECKNWAVVADYHEQLIKVINRNNQSIVHTKKNIEDQQNGKYWVSCYNEPERLERFNKIASILEPLRSNSDVLYIQKQLLEAKKLEPKGTNEYDKVIGKIKLAARKRDDFQFYYPVISFHADNRYARWLFGDGENTRGVIRGDFGFSYSSHQPVGQIISNHIGYTLFFSLAGILLAYLISIPLGVYAAVKKDSWFDRSSSVVLFLLYSMPSFWLATLLLVSFANPDTLYWFEQSGIKPVQGYPAGASLWQKLCISFPYIVLPLVCYTYSSLAFLSRTLRVSVLENIKQDYITTARAKGLPEGKVVWRHAFRNSLLPLITVLANIFPYAIGGSVVLETIFTLPGMGFETYRAITGQDYPVIMAMLTLTSILTIVGLLVQDILYALADPRISFDKRN